MEKTEIARLRDMCRELFFPFDTKFFREDYCLSDDAPEDLKRIEQLFILPNQEALTTNDSSSIVLLPSYETVDFKSKPNSIQSLNNKDNIPTEPIFNDVKSKFPEISEAIFQQLVELLSESHFDRSALDQWLFFHGKLTALKASPNSMANDIIIGVKPKIEELVNSVNREDSIWMYAEKAFFEHFKKNIAETESSLSYYYPHTALDRFSSIIVVIKEILQIQNRLVRTVYYTSLNTLKHLFDENRLFCTDSG